MSDASIPIPGDLLSHESIKDYPNIVAMHEEHGGIPADADEGVLEEIMEFTNAIAHNNVDPTRMRRSDPSPRRSARVFRAEVLGHREPSVSPERRRSISQTRASRDPAPSLSAGDNISPVRSRSRYRSRSRPPNTIREEPEFEREGRFGWDQYHPTAHGSGTPGRRDEPEPKETAGTQARIGPDPAKALENRLHTLTQQQHNFYDRIMHAIGEIEVEQSQIQARHTNKINYYLGEPLMPVSNGKRAFPRHLPPLTSVEVIQALPAKDVRCWLAYYTGKSPQQLLEADQRRNPSHDAEWVSQDMRRALRACTGVEPVFMT